MEISGYDLYIFDLDGTIINSEGLMKNALKHCAEKHNIIINQKEFFSLMGMPLEEIFTKMQISSKLVDTYNTFCMRNIKLIELYKHAILWLENLAKQKKKIILLTGKNRYRTTQILEYFNLNSYFDCLICGDDLNGKKPDPTSVLIMMEKYKVHRSKTVLIGDSYIDMKTAKNANIDSIFVTWGIGKENDIKDLKVKKILDKKEDRYFLENL